jgi:N-acyl-L-homoserine lactone synthetase
LGGAYLLSTCLHETCRDLIVQSAKAAFSRREHDTLCWGAEGKRNAEMEFEQYDNVATEYFVARDAEGNVRGVCRSYPTTIPYMLSDVFCFLCSQELPFSHKIHEASRLAKEARRPIVDELIVAYMERGLHRNIDADVALYCPEFGTAHS